MLFESLAVGCAWLGVEGVEAECSQFSRYLCCAHAVERLPRRLEGRGEEESRHRMS